MKNIQKPLNTSSALVPLVLFLLLLLVGCSNPAKEVIGHWTIDADHSTMGGKAASSNPMGEQFLKTVSLDIKPDKTFQMTLLIPMEGTYVINGNTVTFHMTSMMGIKPTTPNENHTEDLQGTLSSDGKTISVNEKGDLIVFLKAPSS